jgi:hypothetical protein
MMVVFSPPSETKSLSPSSPATQPPNCLLSVNRFLPRSVKSSRNVFKNLTSSSMMFLLPTFHLAQNLPKPLSKSRLRSSKLNAPSIRLNRLCRTSVPPLSRLRVRQRPPASLEMLCSSPLPSWTFVELKPPEKLLALLLAVATRSSSNQILSFSILLRDLTAVWKLRQALTMRLNALIFWKEENNNKVNERQYN